MPVSVPVFVFGSNLAGMHSGGAARCAYRDRGAEMGVARGPDGHARGADRGERGDWGGWAVTTSYDSHQREAILLTCARCRQSYYVTHAAGVIVFVCRWCEM